MNCLTHACLIAMLPWTEEPAKRGFWMGGRVAHLFEMRGLIVSALIDRRLAVEFRCEPMGWRDQRAL